MSAASKVITVRNKVAGVLTDATSMLFNNAAGTIGVRRADTLASVVAAGTAITRQSAGVYQYTISGALLVVGVTYEYWVERLYGGAYTREERTFVALAESVDASPSLHSYSFKKLQQQCQHATGMAKPKASTLSVGGSSEDAWKDVVNDALLSFAQLRPWSWREEPLSLNLTADQSYVTLPADFGQLKVLHRASSIRGAAPVSLDRLIRYRAAGLGAATLDLRYAIAGKRQASATAHPTHRLEIWPTPTADVSDALVGIYLRLPGPMSGATDVPDLPPRCHPAFRAFMRMRACEHEQLGDKAAAEREAFTPLYNALVEEEGGMKGDLGAVEGFAMQGVECDLDDSGSNSRLFPTQWEL